MDMNGVLIHAEIGNPDAHPITGFYHQMIDGGKHLTIERKDVEIQHHRRIRSIGSGMDRPLMQHDGKVAINSRIFRFLGMNDEKPHHAHSQLNHFICMRVVHKRAILLECKFIYIGFAGINMGLIESANPIHAIG